MPDVRAIPDGYHSVQPYLYFKSSPDAIAFYTKAFGATERLRMAGNLLPFPGGPPSASSVLTAVAAGKNRSKAASKVAMSADRLTIVIRSRRRSLSRSSRLLCWTARRASVSSTMDRSR